MTKLPDRMIDLILNDNNNWDQDYLFKQTQIFYFYPTEKGISYLDKVF